MFNFSWDGLFELNLSNIVKMCDKNNFSVLIFYNCNWWTYFNKFNKNLHSYLK